MYTFLLANFFLLFQCREIYNIYIYTHIVVWVCVCVVIYESV
jgi:hypothetical protein